MPMMSKYTLGDLFTDDELNKAVELRAKHQLPTQLIKALVDEVTQPALERINAKTGQANDPRYLAYVLEYGIGEIARG